MIDDWIPSTLLSAATLAVGIGTYLRVARQEDAVGWRVEKRDDVHVLVCTAGVAKDVKIDLGEHNSATRWGQLEHAELTKGAVVAIGGFAPRSNYFGPDVVTVTWRVGRRREKWTAQIL